MAMTCLVLTWDEAKNRSNRKDHKVSFETAVRVFDDPFHLSEQDRVEDGEERWQTLGPGGWRHVGSHAEGKPAQLPGLLQVVGAEGDDRGHQAPRSAAAASSSSSA